jgi:hypothetical protein
MHWSYVDAHPKISLLLNAKRRDVVYARPDKAIPATTALRPVFPRLDFIFIDKTLLIFIFSLAWLPNLQQIC